MSCLGYRSPSYHPRLGTPHLPQPLSALQQWHGSCPLIASLTADLEALGYGSWAQRMVTAAGFGVPLDAQRVYVVASRHGDARDVLLAEVSGKEGVTVVRKSGITFLTDGWQPLVLRCRRTHDACMWWRQHMGMLGTCCWQR